MIKVSKVPQKYFKLNPTLFKWCSALARPNYLEKIITISYFWLIRQALNLRMFSFQWLADTQLVCSIHTLPLILYIYYRFHFQPFSFVFFFWLKCGKRSVIFSFHKQTLWDKWVCLLNVNDLVSICRFHINRDDTESAEKSAKIFHPFDQTEEENISSFEF